MLAGTVVLAGFLAAWFWNAGRPARPILANKTLNRVIGTNRIQTVGANKITSVPGNPAANVTANATHRMCLTSSSAENRSMMFWN